MLPILEPDPLSQLVEGCGFGSLRVRAGPQLLSSQPGWPWQPPFTYPRLGFLLIQGPWRGLVKIRLDAVCKAMWCHRDGKRAGQGWRQRIKVGKFSTYQPDSVPLQTVQGLCQSVTCSLAGTVGMSPQVSTPDTVRGPWMTWARGVC